MAWIPPARRPRVLIVDDNLDNLHMYAVYLRSQGFEAFEARNGAEAIAVLSVTEADMIVMDLGMPVMDGWEAIRRIKRDRRSHKIPVIVLTAHVISGEERRARKLGATSYLTKPCLPEDLAYEIRRVLRIVGPAAAPGARPPGRKKRPRS